MKLKLGSSSRLNRPLPLARESACVVALAILFGGVLFVFSGAAAAETVWTHNGSTIRWVSEGSDRKAYYQIPKAGLRAIGIIPGQLLFEGHRRGDSIEGYAYSFKKGCPPSPFAVSGKVVSESQIVLNGRTPTRAAGCVAQNTSQDTVLRFDYVSQAETAVRNSDAISDGLPMTTFYRRETPSLEAATAPSSASGVGPSFDCSKASALDERAICADPALSSTERTMTTTFGYVLKNYGALPVRELARESLRARRTCGADGACIKKSMLKSIREYQDLIHDRQPHDITIEEYCTKKWDTDPEFSNVAYKQCVSDQTASVFREIDSSMCEPAACYYRLAPIRVQGLDDGESAYQGLGYVVRYKNADSGREILILDPQGELSMYGQCGTCNGMDYSKGPLDNVVVRTDGRDLILEVPNDR
jgi:uncharacterized protein